MTSEVRGLPLDEYTRQTPPGWRPYLRNYPLSLYEEKLRLWIRLTDIPEDCHGSVVVGRLKSSAYRLALKIRIRRQDGQLITGDEAVNLPRQQAQPAQGLPASPSGLEQIISDLRAAFGDDAQDLQAFHLDKFFELHRGSHSLIDFLTAFKLKYEAAEEHAGLMINQVGLTHLLLAKAGLTQRFIDDLMLKVDGDRARFDDIFKLLMKFSKGQTSIGDATEGNMFYQHGEETEDECYSTVEYLTDSSGHWYIYDYTNEQAFYINVSEDDQVYWQASVADY
jgi:hypothetical protein